MNKIVSANTLPISTILMGDYDYKIIEKLGQGGFGIVYKAENLTTGELVAIKEYFPSQLGISRDVTDGFNITAGSEDDLAYFKVGLEKFKKEALALSKFSHPNIVEIIDYMSQFGTEFFVMPYEEGITLKKYVDTFGKYPVNQIMNLIIPILNGLKEMHKHKLYHRDIKPDNIFLRKEGMPMIIDFGAARQAVGEKSLDFTQLLTHGYAPPEQYETNSKKQGPWTDFYALSGTIYSLLVGEKPASAPDRTGSLVNEDEKDPFTYPSSYEGLDEKFLTSLSRCMCLNRKERFQNADEWLAFLFEKNIKTGILKKGHKLAFSKECYIEIEDHFDSSHGENRYTAYYITATSKSKCIFNELTLSKASSSQYTKEIIEIYQNYALYPMCKSNFLELLTRPYLVDDGISGNYRIIDRDTITIREYLTSKALEILSEEEIVDLALQVLSFLIKCKNGKNLIHLGLTLDSILIDDNHQILLSNPGWARYCQLLFWDKNAMTHIPNFSMAEMDINYKKGSANSLSDMYALGVIMYRLMIGVNVSIPNVEERVRVMSYNSGVDPYVEPSSKFSREFIDIVMKAIALNSSERIQSAEEFIDLLNNILPINKNDNLKEKSFLNKLFN